MTTKDRSVLNLDPQQTALVRFLWNAEEILVDMEEGMARLEDESTSLELAEQLHYLAYRLREGAADAEMDELASLAGVVENVFEQARRGQVEMTSDLIALLLPSCKALRRMTGGVSAEEREALVAPESGAIGEVVESVL